MVYILLGKGFEEAEAIIPCDLLRRAGVEVQFAAVGSKTVAGGHRIEINADCMLEEIDFDKAEMIVLPGGMGGVQSISQCTEALEAVKRMHAQGKYVAAICAAPTILAKLGLLSGKKATCYPGMENEMEDAIMCNADAVTDGKLITGRAAGTAFDFALALIEALCGADRANQIATGVVFR
ncbi:MAG: DJ-1/PfpI family protein [Ruminococcaceae bacterium]|nr:DJ-1/PfpI family protein [Oscillospiraceae bacterium]